MGRAGSAQPVENIGRASPKVPSKPVENGETAINTTLTDEEIARYRRHLVLKEIGGEGQQRLKSPGFSLWVPAD